jgi:hypothetical protein
VPKHFFRRCVFLVFVLFQVPLQAVMLLIDTLIACYRVFDAILHLTNFRLECWAHGIPKGTLDNCPWETRYGDLWKNNFTVF